MKKHAPHPLIVFILAMYFVGVILAKYVAAKTLGVILVYAVITVAIFIGVFVGLDKYDKWRKS